MATGRAGEIPKKKDMEKQANQGGTANIENVDPADLQAYVDMTIGERIKKLKLPKPAYGEAMAARLRDTQMKKLLTREPERRTDRQSWYRKAVASVKEGATVDAAFHNFKQHGITYESLRRRCLPIDSKLFVDVEGVQGRPTKLEKSEIRAVLDIALDGAMTGDCVPQDDVRAMLEDLALEKGCPFRNGNDEGMSSATWLRYKGLIREWYSHENWTFQTYPRNTSSARTIASEPGSPGRVEYGGQLAELMRRHPYLAQHPELLVNIDETGHLTHIEKIKGDKCAVPQTVLRRDGIPARQKISTKSGSRCTSIFCVSADGHCYPPGTYVKGEVWQPSCVAAYGGTLYPPGVTPAAALKYPVIKTPEGVATMWSHIPMLKALLTTVRARVNAIDPENAGRSLIVFLDGDSTHDVDKATGVLGGEVAAVCKEYGAITCKYPSNTSTVLCPLDTDLLGLVKKDINRLIKSLNAIWSNRLVHYELDPRTLKKCKSVIQTNGMIKCKANRALGLKNSAAARTYILGIQSLIVVRAEEYSVLIKKGFRRCGYFPFLESNVSGVVSNSTQRLGFGGDKISGVAGAEPTSPPHGVSPPVIKRRRLAKSVRDAPNVIKKMLGNMDGRSVASDIDVLQGIKTYLLNTIDEPTQKLLAFRNVESESNWAAGTGLPPTKRKSPWIDGGTITCLEEYLDADAARKGEEKKISDAKEKVRLQKQAAKDKARLAVLRKKAAEVARKQTVREEKAAAKAAEKASKAAAIAARAAVATSAAGKIRGATKKTTCQPQRKSGSTTKSKAPKSSKKKLLCVSAKGARVNCGHAQERRHRKRPNPSNVGSPADESIKRCQLAVSRSGRIKVRKQYLSEPDR